MDKIYKDKKDKRQQILTMRDAFEQEIMTNVKLKEMEKMSKQAVIKAFER